MRVLLAHPKLAASGSSADQRRPASSPKGGLSVGIIASDTRRTDNSYHPASSKLLFSPAASYRPSINNATVSVALLPGLEGVPPPPAPQNPGSA